MAQSMEEAGRGQGMGMAQYIQGLTGGVTQAATLGGLGATKLIDPKQREINGFMDAVTAQIPGLSKNLFPVKDLWGRDVEPQALYGKFADWAIPFRASQLTGNPIDMEMANLGMGHESIPRKGMFDGVPVNFKDFPEVYDRYVRLAGNELKHPAFGRLGAMDYLNQEVTNPRSIYNSMPFSDAGKQQHIDKIITQYRSLAQQQILAEAPMQFPAFAEKVKELHSQMDPMKYPLNIPMPARPDIPRMPVPGNPIPPPPGQRSEAAPPLAPEQATAQPAALSQPSGFTAR